MSFQSEINLPPEVWEVIWQYFVTDTGMYLPLLRVCKLFKLLLARHAPKFYINPVLYSAFVPDNGIISVRKLRKPFGYNGGLATTINSLFAVIGRNKSFNAWLKLKPQPNGWYCVEDAYWRSKTSQQ